MSTSSRIPAPPRDPRLSIAVISPDRHRRIAATLALDACGNAQLFEFTEYPSSLDEVLQPRQRQFDVAMIDVVLIDMESDPERAVALLEQLCGGDAIVAMAFSGHADTELMLRSMRAGAREFFILPFNHDAIARALSRVAVRLQPPPPQRKADGRMHVFFGAKGGVGVTTLACNFAVALAEESGRRTLLIDLNFHLGDAALNLGIDARHSVIDALQDSARLDAKLLSTFLADHDSGLRVLAAPSQAPLSRPGDEDLGRLLAVARQQFDNVVVDAGKKINLRPMHLFDESTTAYLVTQVGIPELRNANRLITQFSADPPAQLEIVINRHQSRFLGLTDEHLNKALTRPVGWKVPNDFKAVKQMQSSATPLVHLDSPIAGVIRQMARAACGLVAAGQRESALDLVKAGLGLGRKAESKRLGPESVRPPAEQAGRAAGSSAGALSG